MKMKREGKYLDVLYIYALNERGERAVFRWLTLLKYSLHFRHLHLDQVRARVRAILEIIVCVKGVVSLY